MTGSTAPNDYWQAADGLRFLSSCIFVRFGFIAMSVRFATDCGANGFSVRRCFLAARLLRRYSGSCDPWWTSSSGYIIRIQISYCRNK